MAQSLMMTRPDDWHVHFRQGDALLDVVHHTARCFGRALVMPNLTPPVTTVAQALQYRQEIISASPLVAFEPLMTLYLTDDTPVEEVWRAKESGIVHAVKLYPRGATTNSVSGVTDLSRLYPVLAEMERVGLVLSIHGEATAPADPFDAERLFVDETLTSLVKSFPGLKIVLEHVTTAEAVDFVQSASPRVAATITAHHLRYSRADLFDGGIRPHLFCRPVLKRAIPHRQAVLAAATSGSPKFFLGTDSAPHPLQAKESACGCAGCYSAPCALELYTEVFEAAGMLDRLEGFASFHGADFYGLPRNADTVTLVRQPWIVRPMLEFGAVTVRPLCAGETLIWRIAE